MHTATPKRAKAGTARAEAATAALPAWPPIDAVATGAPTKARAVVRAKATIFLDI